MLSALLNWFKPVYGLISYSNMHCLPFDLFLKVSYYNLEMFFWCLQFLLKTNENKSTCHSCKVEFICSVFGRNVGLKNHLNHFKFA